MTTTVSIAGEAVVLLPDRAVHWPAGSTLFVADTHFGKADHFRAAGVPVPDGPTARDLARLTRLCAETGVKRLVVLGDVFHAPGSHSAELHAALADFRAAHAALDVQLVRGNHDRHAGPAPRELRLTDAGDRLDVGPFACVHEPPAEPIGSAAGGRFALAGHVHPAVRLRDPRTGKGVRLPCFHETGHCLTLPPFGSFTGHAVVTPGAGDRVYAIAPGGGAGGGSVVRVPTV